MRSIQYVNQMTSCKPSTFVAAADLIQITGGVVAGGKGWAQWLEVGDRSFLFDLSHDEWAESGKIRLVTSRFHDAIICGWKMRIGEEFIYYGLVRWVGISKQSTDITKYLEQPPRMNDIVKNGEA